MANKLINCKVCGAEMAASAKTCPKCGAKNKKPLYKKWWFYVLVVLVLLFAIGSAGGNSESGGGSETVKAQTAAQKTPEPVSYTHYNVTELFDALNSNAMKAQDTYKDQYVELEGYLGTIDSDGKYFGLEAAPDQYDYLFQDVQCYLKNDEQKSQIMEISKGDPLVVRGKITQVGELLGYSLYIDSIG